MSTSGNPTAAEFLSQHGWGVGTVLQSATPTTGSKHAERPRQVRITGIGVEDVLGVTRVVGEETWGREMHCDFNSHNWTVAE